MGGVAPPWIWAGLPKKGLSRPVEVRPHPQMIVTDFCLFPGEETFLAQKGRTNNLKNKKEGRGPDLKIILNLLGT